MKILLTQRFVAREPRTPIALIDLAAYGRRFGHEIDVAYDEEQDISADYDFVGVSAIVVDDDVLDSLKSIRQRYPGRLVLGGKGAATLLNKARATLDQLDVEVFEGSGEKLLNNGMPIDYADYPAWSADDLRILGAPDSAVELMSTRGCPYHCHFCNNTEPKVRYFSPERTIANASLLLNMMGRQRVFFVDDIFTLRASHMMAILAEADRVGLELRKRTHFFVHVNLVDDQRLDAIDAFEPAEIQIGIESGDDGMIEAMGKTYAAAKAEHCLKLLHSHGHAVACLFLFGFPGETRTSLQRTIDFVARNREYMSGVWISYYQPIPGTRGWDMVKERLGHEVEGKWNTEITFLDPNLTAIDLIEARRYIMGD